MFIVKLLKKNMFLMTSIFDIITSHHLNLFSKIAGITLNRLVATSSSRLRDCAQLDKVYRNSLRS